MSEILLNVHLRNLKYNGFKKICMLLDERWQTIAQFQNHLLKLTKKTNVNLQIITANDYLIPSDESIQILRHTGNDIYVRAVPICEIEYEETTELSQTSVQENKRKLKLSKSLIHSTPAMQAKRAKVDKSSKISHESSGTSDTEQAKRSNSVINKIVNGEANVDEIVKRKEISFHCALDDLSMKKPRRIAVNNLLNTPISKNQLATALTSAERTADIQTHNLSKNIQMETSANVCLENTRVDNKINNSELSAAGNRSIFGMTDLSIDEEASGNHELNSSLTSAYNGTTTDFGDTVEASIINLSDSLCNDTTAKDEVANNSTDMVENIKKQSMEKLLANSEDIFHLPDINDIILFQMQSNNVVSKYLAGKVEYINKRTKLVRLQLIDGSNVILPNNDSFDNVTDVLTISFADMLGVKRYQAIKQ